MHKLPKKLLVLIIALVTLSIVCLSILKTRHNPLYTYYYDTTEDSKYILNNGLQLYMDYDDVAKILGDADQAENYSVGDGVNYPIHYYKVLYYDGLVISMLAVDEAGENTNEPGIGDYRIEQIQIFGGDYSTSEKSAVGQTVTKLKSAYRFGDDLDINRINESRLGSVFNKEIENGRFDKYDSFCYVATPIFDNDEGQDNKGLLFLIKSDKVQSIVIFNPRPIIMTPKIY